MSTSSQTDTEVEHFRIESHPELGEFRLFELNTHRALRFVGVHWSQCEIDNQIAASAIYYTREAFCLIDAVHSFSAIRSVLLELIEEARGLGISERYLALYDEGQ